MIHEEIIIRPDEIETIILDTNGLKKMVFAFKNARFVWSAVKNSSLYPNM